MKTHRRDDSVSGDIEQGAGGLVMVSSLRESVRFQRSDKVLRQKAELAVAHTVGTGSLRHFVFTHGGREAEFDYQVTT
jgi:hypothetical protein